MSNHTPSHSNFASLFCAGAGVFLLTLGAAHSFALVQGAFFQHLAVCLVLLFLSGLAFFLLSRTQVSNQFLCYALMPIALAFLLRALALDHITYDYQDFLSHWAAFFRENGGFSAIRQPIGDYNAPYLYFMAAISYLPFPDLYAIKLCSIFFDVILAWGGLRLAQVFCDTDSLIPLYTFLLLLLLPTVVLNGAYWGQCDSLYGALVLHALACVAKGRSKTSVVLLAVAFSFKLQTIFLIPLWGALWLVGRVKLTHLFLFPAAYVATILPALALGKPLNDILSVYFNQAGQYTSALVFNAPSMFALLPHGLSVNATLFSKLGILAAFLLCLFVMGFCLLRRKEFSEETLLAAAAVLALGVPFLLPYMHERYFFLADVITLVWACRYRTRIPVALLTQLASLSSYCVYLRLQYTLPLRLFGQVWVMGGEALFLLLAFILSLIALVQSTPPNKRLP